MPYKLVRWEREMNDDYPITYIGIEIADGTCPHWGDRVRVVNPLHVRYGHGATVQSGCEHERLCVRFDDCESGIYKASDLVDGGLSALQTHFPDAWESIIDREG